MAEEEQEKKQQSPIQTSTDIVRMGMKIKGKGAMARMGTQLAVRAAVALAPAAPFIIVGLVVILLIVLFIVVILVAIGVIGGGGSSAYAFGSGLGVKENYCQNALSPQDLNGDGQLNDCSQVLLGILNEAAGAARMPTGVLVAIGLSENLKGVMRMNEEDIARYSGPGAEMPDCAESDRGAKGPMQFTDGSVPGTFDTWSAYKDFIITAGARPEGYEPKICNIKDSIYAAAHKLKSDSGIPFDDPATGWTEEQVFAAARAYLGACESRGVTYCENVWEFYNNKKDAGVGVTDLVAAPCGWPTTGTITALFGGGTAVEDAHSGLDIAPNTPVGVSDGQVVYNTMTGTITFAQWTDVSGGRIQVSSTVGETTYTVAYVHMSRGAADTMIARLNGTINRGEAIGRTYSDVTGDLFVVSDGIASPGELPHSSGTHLHYEVRVDGSLVDPQERFTPEELELWGVIESTGGCPDTGTADVNDLFNFSGNWPDSEKDSIAQAVSVPLRSNTWQNLVFGNGKVNLVKVAVNPCPAVCSAFVPNENTINIYPELFSKSSQGRVLVITHELAHILELRNPSVFSRDWSSRGLASDSWLATATDKYHKTPIGQLSLAYQEFRGDNLDGNGTGLVRSYPASLCSGLTCTATDVDIEGENFAEVVGAYVASRDGSDLTPAKFKQEYPEQYKFAKDVIFGGVEF